MSKPYASKQHSLQPEGRNRASDRWPALKPASAIRRWSIVAPLALFAASVVSAGEESPPLTAEELETLVSGKTAECRKEKDQSQCVTFFSDEGRVVQVLADPEDRKDGRWFLDDADRLCILWDGRIKPLCFVVDRQSDGTYRMVKNGRHLSSMTALFDGNRDGL